MREKRENRESREGGRGESIELGLDIPPVLGFGHSPPEVQIYLT